MAKESKPKTCEEYVLNKLAETEEQLDMAKRHNDTLQEDVDNFCEDFLKIRDHFKVDLNTSKTELRICFKYDPSSEYDWGTTIIYSGSLNPKEFKKEFAKVVELLKLEDSVDKVLEELENEKQAGSSEAK